MRFNVIVTQEPSAKLSRLVRNIQNITLGMAPKIVKRDAPGKYGIVYPNNDTSHPVIRVHNGMIFARKATQEMERLLRENNISFLEYEDVEIEDPNAKDPKVRFPLHPNLEYMPPKKQSA